MKVNININIKPGKKMMVVNDNLVMDNRVFKFISRKFSKDSRTKTLQFIVKNKSNITNLTYVISCLKETYKRDSVFLQKLNNLQNGDIEECSICYDYHYDDNIKLPCNHIFGEKCIEKWLVNDTTCPLCKKLTYKFKNKLDFLQFNDNGSFNVDQNPQVYSLREIRSINSESHDIYPMASNYLSFGGSVCETYKHMNKSSSSLKAHKKIVNVNEDCLLVLSKIDAEKLGLNKVNTNSINSDNLKIKNIK